MAAAKAPAEEPVTSSVDEPLVGESTSGLDTPLPKEEPVGQTKGSIEPHAPAQRKSSAFLGFVFGGLIAAGAGFGLAKYVPDGWPNGGSANDVSASLSTQSQAIADLSAKVDTLSKLPTLDEGAVSSLITTAIDQELANLPALSDASSALQSQVEEMTAKLADIERRLTAIETLPMGDGTTASNLASAAFERELLALKDQVSALSAGGTGSVTEIQSLADDLKTQLSATSKELQTIQAEAAANAALGRVQSALEVGGPYAEALAAIAATGLAVPDPLSVSAETGVKSLDDLQKSFPEYARAALEASRRADMGESWTERLTSFFKVQTGVRSLQPKEGSDPDAILSRAESALNSGQLGDALSELAQLPDAAKTSMADWISLAQARMAATEAFSTLAAAMDKA